MTIKNPYITGNPVGNENVFVGRDEIIKTLSEIVENSDKNSLVLYGQRRIGKTSVLQKFESILKKEKYKVISFDLIGRAKYPIKKVWEELEERIRDQLGQINPHNGQQSFYDWLSDTLSILSRYEGNDSSLTLLLDEFDSLEEWENPEEWQAIGELFPQLRHLLNKHKNFNCIFTIGRDIKSLSNKVFSQLKGIEECKISLLDKNYVSELINFSKEKFDWAPEVVKEIERLTNGQAYCVQLLCSQIWDRFYSESRSTVSLQNVNEIVERILSPEIFKSDIWDGLSIAGKIIASVLSEFDEGATIKQLLDKIQDKGGIANVMQKDLEEVPSSMIALDFIEQTKDNRYKFKIELIRLYVKKFEPLHKVQPELDRIIDPAANELYETAHKLVRLHNRHDDAVELLERAIKSNPRHIRANQLLANIRKDQRRYKEAYNVLREFHKHNPHAAKSELINILMIMANDSERNQDKVKFYDELLQLEPDHQKAKKQRDNTWKQLEEKRHRPIGQAKKFISTYQKLIAQIVAFIFGLGISYFLPTDFPDNPSFEIERAKDSYRLISIPSSKSHLLTSIQIIIDAPNAKPEEVTLKYGNYKPVILKPLVNTETPTYQIDSVSLNLKNDSFQYPFVKSNESNSVPIFIINFKMIQNVEFRCTAGDKASCDIKPKDYSSLLRGILWWMIGTLLGFILFVIVELFYAFKNRERDDVL